MSRTLNIAALLLFVISPSLASAQSARIDSSVTENWTGAGWMNTDKLIYTYDPAGDTVGIRHQTWSGYSSSWYDSSTTLRHYGPDGALDSVGYYNGFGGPIDRHLYIRDTTKGVGVNLYQVWPAPGNGTTWINVGMDSLFFDSRNELTGLTAYEWSDSWKPYSRYSNSYQSGRISEQAVQMWNNGWQNHSVEFFSYAGGKLAVDMDRVWVDGDSAYQNDARQTYSYDSSGNVTSEVFYLWSDGAWNNAQQYLYTYDSRHDRVSWLTQWPTGPNGSWITEFKDTYAFDSTGNLIRHIRMSLPTDTTVLRNVLMETYLYDGAGNRVEYLEQTWQDTDWVNRTMIRYYPEVRTAVQQAGLRETSGYRLLQNYPNPFNPTTTIMFYVRDRSRVTLSIFNVLGQMVEYRNYGMMESGSHEKSIDMSRFASGVYLYRLQAGSHSAVKKMLLLK